MNLYDKTQVERVWQRVHPDAFGRGGKPAGASDGFALAKQLLVLSDGYRRLGFCRFSRECAMQARRLAPNYALSPGMLPQNVTRQSQKQQEAELLRQATGALANASRNRLRYL